MIRIKYKVEKNPFNARFHLTAINVANPAFGAFRGYGEAEFTGFTPNGRVGGFASLNSALDWVEGIQQ